MGRGYRGGREELDVVESNNSSRIPSKLVTGSSPLFRREVSARRDFSCLFEKEVHIERSGVMYEISVWINERRGSVSR